MLNVVWRASALDDFATIVEFIAQRNVAAAENLKLDTQACIERAKPSSTSITSSSIASP